MSPESSFSESASQSINISGGQLSNVQIGGQAGRDLNVTQSQQVGSGVETPLTSSEVADLLTQLQTILVESNLTDTEKNKIVRSLETAKDEVQTQEPDKEFAVKNLQRATKVLKDAGETVEAGTGLWQKIQPILDAVSPWLGVAASFLI